MNEFQLFADCRCDIMTESPMWNKAQQCLYWRDFYGNIYRKGLGGAPSDFERFTPGIGGVGSMAFTTDETMLLFGFDGTIWKWIPGEKPELYRKFGGSLFNDCLVDSRGRIFCGMLADNYFDGEKRGKNGRLWRLDPNGSFNLLLDDLTPTPNGVRIFGDKLYLAVTDSGCIYVFDYDAESGAISDRRVFARCSPDGITVDSAGNVWCASCGCGDPLQVFTPDGSILREYKLPVCNTISVAFGGADDHLVFVSTAREDEAAHEHGGSIFVMQNEIAGCEEFVLKKLRT